MGDGGMGDGGMGGGSIGDGSVRDGSMRDGSMCDCRMCDGSMCDGSMAHTWYKAAFNNLEQVQYGRLQSNESPVIKHSTSANSSLPPSSTHILPGVWPK